MVLLVYLAELSLTQIFKRLGMHWTSLLLSTTVSSQNLTSHSCASALDASKEVSSFRSGYLLGSRWLYTGSS